MGVSGVTSTLFKRKIQDFWKDPKKAPLSHLCPAAAHAEHTAPCKQGEALRSPAGLNPALWDRAARLLEIGGRGAQASVSHSRALCFHSWCSEDDIFWVSRIPGSLIPKGSTPARPQVPMSYSSFGWGSSVNARGLPCAEDIHQNLFMAGICLYTHICFK